jgi:hypothetical protein
MEAEVPLVGVAADPTLVTVATRWADKLAEAEAESGQLASGALAVALGQAAQVGLVAT